MRLSQLPTADEMFANATRCLSEAYCALSDAADWLRSDWHPVDTPLTDQQAQRRLHMFAAIKTAKEAINNARRGGD